MSEPQPSFFARLFLSWVAYFRTLFDAEFAAGVVRLRAGALPAPEPEPPKIAPPKIEAASPDAALQLLAILQREGRFIDFLEEDVQAFSDADIGAAARLVHEGCKKALAEHFTIEPTRDEEEGTKVTLEAGYDAARSRVTGNVVGGPPFTGTVEHRGWMVRETRLPKIAEEHDVSVLAPAEIEL